MSVFYFSMIEYFKGNHKSRSLESTMKNLVSCRELTSVLSTLSIVFQNCVRYGYTYVNKQEEVVQFLHTFSH